MKTVREALWRRATAVHRLQPINPSLNEVLAMVELIVEVEGGQGCWDSIRMTRCFGKGKLDDCIDATILRLVYWSVLQLDSQSTRQRARSTLGSSIYSNLVLRFPEPCSWANAACTADDPRSRFHPRACTRHRMSNGRQSYEYSKQLQNHQKSRLSAFTSNLLCLSRLTHGVGTACLSDRSVCLV